MPRWQGSSNGRAQVAAVRPRFQVAEFQIETLRRGAPGDPWTTPDWGIVPSCLLLPLDLVLPPFVGRRI